jgi:symplekin
MFAALAAQGDKAAGSLQILSSSIASDLLADVVMVNMQHMPVSRPEIDEQQHHLPSTSSEDGLSVDFPLLASLFKVCCFSFSLLILDSLLHFCLSFCTFQRASQIDQDEVPTAKDSAVVPSIADDIKTIPANSLVPSSVNAPMEENCSTPIVPLDTETAEANVLSAGATNLFDIRESSEASHASTELQGTQEHAGSLISSPPIENSSAGPSLAQSSEAHSPNSSAVETNQSQLSSSNALNSQHVLPKLDVNNVDLSDEAKDLLQKEAFMRIVESDKQEASSGSLARLPLLAHLGVEVHRAYNISSGRIVAFAELCLVVLCEA